jgi:hypothetical protein
LRDPPNAPPASCSSARSGDIKRSSTILRQLLLSGPEAGTTSAASSQRSNGIRAISIHASASSLATPEPIKEWSLTSLKEKLIKIGAKIVSHGRYVAFHIRWPKSPFPKISLQTFCG